MKTLGELPLRTVPVIEPSTFLDEAVLLMREEPLRTVVLVGDEQFMGVFNEDALLANLIPDGANFADLAVGPYVHPVRVIGSPDMTTADALSLMERKGQDILPVVEHHVRYKGVLTRADIASVI